VGGIELWVCGTSHGAPSFTRGGAGIGLADWRIRRVAYLAEGARWCSEHINADWPALREVFKRASCGLLVTTRARPVIGGYQLVDVTSEAEAPRSARW